MSEYFAPWERDGIQDQPTSPVQDSPLGDDMATKTARVVQPRPAIESIRPTMEEPFSPGGIVSSTDAAITKAETATRIQTEKISLLQREQIVRITTKMEELRRLQQHLRPDYAEVRQIPNPLWTDMSALVIALTVVAAIILVVLL